MTYNLAAVLNAKTHIVQIGLIYFIRNTHFDPCRDCRHIERNVIGSKHVIQVPRFRRVNIVSSNSDKSLRQRLFRRRGY